MFYGQNLTKDDLKIFNGDRYIFICPKCEELFTERDPKTINNLDEPTFMRRVRHICKGQEQDLWKILIDEYLSYYKFDDSKRTRRV